MEENKKKVIMVECPFCGSAVPLKYKMIETRQTITPHIGMSVNVEFNMSYCIKGHKFIQVEDLEKTLKNVADFEAKIIAGDKLTE